MSSFRTQPADNQKDNQNQFLEDASSNERHPPANRSRLQNVTFDIFKHYYRFRNLKRMLSWIIGMILFSVASVIIYEQWF